MIQGYKIEALLFELCKYTETRLKLIKMDNEYPTCFNCYEHVKLQQ